MLAALIAFGLAVLAGPGTIYYLRRLKFGQQVRSDGPKTHLKKAGTPSMGGVLILLALAVAVVLTSSMGRDVSIALLATLGYGVIGLLDDGLKIIAKRSLGLRARDKLVGQIGIALLISLFALSQDGLNTSLIVPFVKTSIELHPVVFVIFNILVMVAASNAVNIGGLDGFCEPRRSSGLRHPGVAWWKPAVFFAA